MTPLFCLDVMGERHPLGLPRVGLGLQLSHHKPRSAREGNTPQGHEPHASDFTRYQGTLCPLVQYVLPSTTRKYYAHSATAFFVRRPYGNPSRAGTHREAFMPMWQNVAMQLAEEDPRRKKKLVMAKFDCEQVRP